MVELRDPTGEALQQRGGRVTFREVHRLIDGETPVLVRWDGLSWIGDTAAWWRDHHRQVGTKDHPAVGPWPDREEYVPSVWFSSSGRVVVFDVIC